MNKPAPPAAPVHVPAPAPPVTSDANAALLAAYTSYQETMQHFLRTQEAVMRAFLTGAPDAAVSMPLATPAAAPAPPITPAPVTLPPPVQAVPPALVHTPHIEVEGAAAAASQPEPEFSEAMLSKALVACVSELTGYPTEMLGLDLDLEAELGIGSIRRIEIMDALACALPSDVAAALNDGLDKLSRIHTLRALTEAIMKLTPARIAPTAAAPAPTAAAPAPVAAPTPVAASTKAAAAPLAAAPAPVGGAESTNVPRFVMVAVPEPLSLPHDEKLESAVLVIADSEAEAAPLMERVAARGAAAVTLCSERLTDEAQLQSELARCREQAGTVRRIVDLSGADVGGENRASRLLRVARACKADLLAAGDRALVMAATQLGGAFGRNGRCGPADVRSAGVTGLLRTLHEEWPGVEVRTVDFDDSFGAGEMADRLIEELLFASSEPEVGYAAGTRRVFVPVPAPLHTAGRAVLEPAADWVILATGGARGITAAVVRGMARADTTVVLVGRSAQPTEEAPELAALPNAAALRQHLVREHQRADSTATPAEIEAELRRLLADREMRANMAALQAAGARVEYVACDVRDGAAFERLVADVYAKHGRIDAVLHGAGVIEDALIEDKQPDSFRRVYETKVSSLDTLARSLRPEKLKLLLVFASTAGRFGNVGQGDYAAANETMNRQAWLLHEQWPAVRVVAINWGPWASAGMASDAVNERFRRRGILPIETDAGVRFVLDELAHGPADAVEVIAGEGPWHRQADISSLFDTGLLFLSGAPPF